MRRESFGVIHDPEIDDRKGPVFSEKWHNVEPFFKRCRFLHFCLLMGVVQSTHFCSRAVNCCFTWIEKVFEALVLVWRFATNTSSMAAWVPYELNPHVVNYRVRSLVSQIIHMLRDTSTSPLPKIIFDALLIYQDNTWNLWKCYIHTT